MREKTTPNATHEDIVRLEYLPGQMFVVTVAQGTVVNNEFVRDRKFPEAAIVIQGQDLTDIESIPELSAAINVVMAHAWAKVDEVV